MPTKEETQAKSDATQLKNLRKKKAAGTPLTKREETILKKLAVESKTNPPKKQKRDASQIAWSVVQHVTGAERNWLLEPASPKWKGRKIRHKATQKEYVISDVFGERHVEMDRNAQTTIHNAANLRESYKPID